MFSVACVRGEMYTIILNLLKAVAFTLLKYQMKKKYIDRLNHWLFEVGIDCHPVKIIDIVRIVLLKFM